MAGQVMWLTVVYILTALALLVLGFWLANIWSVLCGFAAGVLFVNRARWAHFRTGY